MSRSNMPELRLEGFKGEWVTGPLSDFLETSAITNSDLAYGREDVYAVSLSAGLVNQIKFHGRSFAGKNLGNYDVVLHDDVVYTKSPLSDAPFGIVKSNSGDPGIVSPLYAVYHPKPGIWSHFVQDYFALHSRLNDYFRPLVSKGAKNTMNISDKDALKGEVTFPSSLQEQRAIGDVFTNLDTTIASHKKKLDLFKQAKASLLQRMFPADGATVPELRLEGFSDSWKEESLADIATYSKGKGYSKADMTEEGTPLFHYGRLYTKYELAVTDVDTFSQVRADSILSRGDEVLVPASGETAEDIATASALLQPGVLLGGDLNVIRPRPGFDSVFLALSLSHGESKAALASRAQGKSVVHVHNPDIQSLVVLFPPTIEEQRAIGAVFAKLDTLISTEAQYIDKLTQTKTALLQKMFV